CSNNNVQRESHAFEICFTEKILTGSIFYGIRFNKIKSMIALFIITAILGIVFIVMVNKSSFATLWAFRIPLRLSRGFRRKRSKLPLTYFTLIFLIAINIFAIFIKFKRIAARTLNFWYNSHRPRPPFGVMGFWTKTIIPEGVRGFQFSFNLTERCILICKVFAVYIQLNNYFSMIKAHLSKDKVAKPWV